MVTVGGTEFADERVYMVNSRAGGTQVNRTEDCVGSPIFFLKHKERPRSSVGRAQHFIRSDSP